MSEFSLPGLLDPVASTAMSQTISGWIFMGVGVLVYTLAGGIVLAILLKIMGSVWGEEYDLGKAFIISLLASLASFAIGIIGFAMIPSPILPVIIWILLVRLFYRDMGWLKVLIAGIAGFFIAQLVGSLIIGYVMTIFLSLGI